MVKGITRQVIVVHAPEPKLFEQAIFILNESASQTGVTEEALLKEADSIIRQGGRKPGKLWYYGGFWAALGALATGAVWLVCWLVF